MPCKTKGSSAAVGMLASPPTGAALGAGAASDLGAGAASDLGAGCGHDCDSRSCFRCRSWWGGWVWCNLGCFWWG